MRILLAEDDCLLQDYLKKGLADEGFAVDAVSDGIDAEHMGSQESYDAVVLDLGLPKRSGIEVLKNWRRSSIGVPVVILTSRDAWNEKVIGFKAGGDDYLGKPFHVEELVARLNALIRRGYGHAGGSMQVNGLKLDEDRQLAITADGNEVQLTGIEFRMLRYFMMRRGHIVSRSVLSEHIYEFDADKDSNVIEVYVNRLRQKFGKDIIATRRGQGYIFGGCH